MLHTVRRLELEHLPAEPASIVTVHAQPGLRLTFVLGGSRAPFQGVEVTLVDSALLLLLILSLGIHVSIIFNRAVTIGQTAFV